jgi:dienelactone hydrolase
MARGGRSMASCDRRRLARAAALLAFALALPAASAERVEFDGAAGTVLTAHWLPAAAAGARPAIVALHGCGGLYRRDGRTLEARYTDYAARFAAAGYHLLLPDSFGSRGAGPICTLRNDERTITVETRRGDAAAAVRWLAARPEVDARRIVLLGWSHGAMTTLVAANSARSGAARPDASTPLAGAVAFYPGCRALLREDFALDSPLLMLLGEKDDWTPPERCVELVARTRARQPAADLTLRVYPDSYHGFDGRAPLRLRHDVPNGVSPAGVHAGGNPVAREQALAELDRFLHRILN